MASSSKKSSSIADDAYAPMTPKESVDYIKECTRLVQAAGGRKSSFEYHIGRRMAPNMRVPCIFYVDNESRDQMYEELHQKVSPSIMPGSLRQVANVAGLPGIVKHSIGLPDMHTGYGFSIGGVAGVDVNDREAVISPGGIGFDINCGVRVLRTNLTEKDVREKQEQLAQAIFDHVPVGVGSEGGLPSSERVLKDALVYGMDWSLREGYAWAEDKELCEEYGRMMTADYSAVSTRALKRGMPQLGTLGAGNHFVEVQVVDEIFDRVGAKRMGLDHVGQVVCMVHCGSRGLGHQVATDSLVEMEAHMLKEGIEVNDPQLACARLNSDVGQKYLKAMSCAANYAWVNRSAMTFLLRGAFSKVFGESPDDLDMKLIYDVSHNIAKFEDHMVDGKIKSLLLHRKGATRQFPPFHPQLAPEYQGIGQPSLIGGSMGTNSHIMLPTPNGCADTFFTTCHGAGRRSSRAALRRHVDYKGVLEDLSTQGISLRVASPCLLMEECAEGYKDVNSVIDVCERAGLGQKCVKLRPLVVIKG